MPAPTMKVGDLTFVWRANAKFVEVVFLEGAITTVPPGDQIVYKNAVLGRPRGLEDFDEVDLAECKSTPPSIASQQAGGTVGVYTLEMDPVFE